MIDAHFIPNSSWGIRPVLFSLGSISVESYPFFVGLGIIVAAGLYYLEVKKQKLVNENSFLIAISALIGGAIGAKIPIWITNYKLILTSNFSPEVFFSGRTIVGGLVGGTLGVYICKKILKIHDRRGNLFAPGIALGMAIGRVGCFLRGCCYGVETTSLTGIDFGDGIHRHPTQLYEGLFDLLIFLILIRFKSRFKTPGSAFKFLIVSYIFFRFLIEFIKFESHVWPGLTIYQLAIPLILINSFRSELMSLTNRIYNQINGQSTTA